MFNKEVYLERRRSLKSKFPKGLLLFLGNDESPMNFKDNTYHFRQDSTFLYYFGINEPYLAAIIDIDEDRVMVFGNEMSIDEIVWMGRQQTLKEKCEASGVANLLGAEEFSKYVKNAKKAERTLHFLPPYRSDNSIKLAQLLTVEPLQVQQMASLPFIKAVIAQRSIKGIEELIELDKAATLSADIQQLVMQKAKPGMYERELAALIQHEALAKGCNMAYPIILTTKGEILHNHYHGHVLQEGQLVLNDSGVETAMGYAGDLTRTFPVSKKFSTAQKQIYDIVLNAYHSAVAMLAPSISYLDVHFKACKTLTEGLKEIGLMKGNVDDAVAAGAHAMFFQCGTGHMMGLDVHDMEDLGEQYVGYTDQLQKNTNLFGLKSLRLGKALEEGFVLTVEPGIYFIPELIDQWQASNKFADFINYDQLQHYRNFSGIRVEDDFLITNDGARMLGRDLALSTSAVEDLRSQAF